MYEQTFSSLSLLMLHTLDLAPRFSVKDLSRIDTCRREEKKEDGATKSQPLTIKQEVTRLLGKETGKTVAEASAFT